MPSSPQPSEAGPPASADVPVDERVYLGVPIALLDTASAAACIAARPAGSPFAYVVTPNAAHFTRLNEVGDARFRDAYQHAWLRLLDGQVPRALARLLFGLHLPHAAGSDVTLLLLRDHIQHDDAVTVIGGTPALRERLGERFGLRHIAQHVPPMGFIRDPAAVARAAAFVRANPARYVFFVVGAPQSEYLARQVQSEGGAVGCGLCVGSALDFAVGLVPRAPAFVRQAGLEGLYRLMRNPLGHARRVFVDSLPVFLTALKARRDPARYGMAQTPPRNLP